MTPKYIRRVGIEFEGGWEDPPKHTGLQNDQSVKLEKEDPTGLCFKGEIASEPLLPIKPVIEQFVDAYYPKLHNSTCAMHIHISLINNSDYLRLMDHKFNEFFQETFKRWGKEIKLKDFHLYWSRFKGYNNFCRDQFRPLEQIGMVKKTGAMRDVRYTQLNYCWAMHKTLECRLFPMFKYKYVAKSAILQFLQCVEDYLAIAPEQEGYELDYSIRKEGNEEIICAL